MDILSIGECMAELAPAEKPGDYRLGFAGDTYNTAWYIARTAPSIHVGYFTAVGGDAISQQMIEAIVRGDTVITSGGLIGKVMKVTEQELSVEVADGFRVRVVKAMVADVRSKNEPAAPANDSKPA